MHASGLAAFAAHRSLDEVKNLVTEDPLLVNATWDWGGGDFETPLQSAAHTGPREIAESLLSQNARPDFFSTAMLGQLAVIKAALAPIPPPPTSPAHTALRCCTALNQAAPPRKPFTIISSLRACRKSSSARRPSSFP